MKKTLALVLALVMVIGLMAVPVKADFTDSSAIEYNEAVDVLSAVGVINGFENGSFDPAGNLTREQAAKIIAYMLLGEDTADALVATSAPFGDVAADRWSAGYISYCVSEGIINGRDANTFDPAGKVTGYEFAKLLLGCLGYSSKIEQYVGASWAINVAKTALDIDLFDGNDGANYNAPMTREEAALYAFNTLKATLVEYDSQGTSIDLGNGVIISTGASKAEEVADADDDSDTIATDALLQFAEKYFEDLELDDAAATADAFGRPAVIWEFDGDEVGTYADEADATYTAEVDGDTIYADCGKTDADTMNYIVDGDDTVADPAGFVIENDNETEIGGNGTLVEVYEDDGDYTVVVINTYVGEVSDWTAADEDDDEDEYVNVSAVTGAPTPAAALTNSGKFETTAFTEDDVDDDTVVLYTAAKNGATYEVQSVVAADSVTAFVSKTSGSSFVADGTTYKYSENYEGTNAAYVEDGDDTLIYLDSYGYAIYVTEVPEADDEYAYVLAVQEDEGLFEDTPYAKLLMPTGEVLVVETDVLYDGGVGNGDDLEGLVVSYTVDDDVYELDAVGAAEYNGAGGDASTDSDITIDTGKTAITLGDSGVTYANSKTIFVVEGLDDDDEIIYTAYTGIANVPNLDAIDDGEFAVIPNEDRTTLADLVFILNAEEDDSSSADELTYVAFNSFDLDEDPTDDANGTYYTANAIVDGVIKTLNLDADLFEVGGDLALVDGDFLVEAYTINSKGVVTEVDLSDVGEFFEGSDTEAEDAGLVGLDGDYFTYDDDTVVYTVDEDGVIAESSIGDIDDDDNDGVIYTVDEDDDTLLVGVYITIVD